MVLFLLFLISFSGDIFFSGKILHDFSSLRYCFMRPSLLSSHLSNTTTLKFSYYSRIVHFWPSHHVLHFAILYTQKVSILGGSVHHAPEKKII